MAVKSPSRAILAGALSLALVACSGGGGDGPGGTTSPPPPPPPDTSSKINTESDAVRFLSRATFGGSKSDIAAIRASEAADWLAAEFAKPATLTLPTLLAQPRDAQGNIEWNQVSDLYWDHILTSNDQLRQRMAFALSQIVVVSDISGVVGQDARADYQDILIRNAFGNYRDLLQEVTYSPAMAAWLTYLYNVKGDPNTGRMPDENYAREVMQLFSIGLIELNMDGTPRLDGQGREIETYNNDDIVGLARVFTGLGPKGGQLWEADADAWHNPLQMYDEWHSPLEKSFLGTTIPANTDGATSINLALDAIFEHPNVAPFLSRQLIQRFTHSSPDPAYVGRVAQAFESGSYTAENGQRFGTGRRGDLEATLAAILLDASIYSSAGDTGSNVQKGKIREPILRFAHWVRAFDVANIDADNEGMLTWTLDPVDGLGQHPMRSPSVFNFYRPGYVAPGTASGGLNMTAPEFQIVNEGSAIGYQNYMTNFAFERTWEHDPNSPSFVPDYSEELALTDTPAALVDHLDTLLTGTRMTSAEKAEIAAILDLLPINTSTPQQEATDRMQRVQTAVTLVLSSPSYAVTW